MSGVVFVSLVLRVKSCVRGVLFISFIFCVVCCVCDMAYVLMVLGGAMGCWAAVVGEVRSLSARYVAPFPSFAREDDCEGV